LVLDAEVEVSLIIALLISHASLMPALRLHHGCCHQPLVKAQSTALVISALSVQY
jgi:hypothetical protein